MYLQEDMFDEKKKRVFVRGCKLLDRNNTLFLIIRHKWKCSRLHVVKTYLANNKAIVNSEHEYYDEYEGYLEESEFGRPAVKAVA